MTTMTPKSERDPQTYAIIGAAMEVHRVLGHGFLEAVYHDAMILEVIERSIPHQTEVKIIVTYKGKSLPSYYKADLICFGEVLVELKAQAKLTSADEAQVINYLKATGMSKALLINFGAPSLEYKRLIYTHNPR
ncbi:MAG TPA: GxxExxY protein [Anaerolineales bacterium]|nr:GxxExxY protein [Anaerolineales bacterium]